MASLAIVACSSNSWAGDLRDRLSSLNVGKCGFVGIEEFTRRGANVQNAAETAYIYVPSYADRECITPDLCEARQVFQQFARLWPHKLILLSSALIYGTGSARQCLVAEDYSAPTQGRDQIAGRWKSLEALAQECWNGSTRFTILRPTTVLPSPAMLSRRFMRRVTITLAGHDPTVQLLSLDDLARAVLCAARSDSDGVFNVAPDAVAPLHTAIKLARGRRLGLARTWQRLADSTEAPRIPALSMDRFQPKSQTAPRVQSTAIDC